MTSKNTDFPRGFRAVSNGTAGTAPRLNEYTVAAATVPGEDDIVALNASALVIVYTTTDAVAGDLIGVAAHPGTAAGKILVYDDPEQLFEAQLDDNTVTATVDFLGKLFGVVKGTASTVTLQSIQEIDGSASSSLFGTLATQVYPLQPVRKSGAVNNFLASGDTWTSLIVRIHPAAHLLGAGGIKLGSGIG